MKKYLLLILCLVSSLMASAESGTCGANLTWSLEDGILVISGTGAMTNYNSYSPNTPWYSSRSTISLAIISEGVTSIGYSAFQGCSGLTSITIPNSVTSIGDYAFFGCSGLTSVTIPNSVTSIGDYAFSNCSSLTSVTIPNSVTSIGDYAFSSCSGLTSITIPNSVTSIGNSAFSGCSGLTSITIGNSVTSIGERAFDGCRSLTSVTIPNSVTSIGKYAFSGCSGLTSVTIPNSVTSIGGSAFSSCSGLTSITIPNSVTSIGDYAFSSCSGLTSITIPNSVTSIGDSAFRGCDGLTSITIPNSVTSVGDEAFGNCSGLTSITIPNSVTSIGWSAFSGCSGLTSVTIPNSVTSIGNYAFSNCSSLTSIIIPNSVTSIGNYAFQRCSGLTSVSVLAATPPACGTDFLPSVSRTKIHVYEGLATVYKAADGWKFYNIVDDIPPVRVTSLTLDATSYQCGIGQRFTPQVVTYEPEDASIKEVTWSSSDPSTLAIVPSTGACIGLKNGIVTITATAKDAGHATATATVYVGNATPATYTISAISADENMGTVSGAGVYAKDAEVTLTATPAEGYKFIRWSDGSTANPYIFQATADKSLTAEFKQIQRTLTDGEAYTNSAEETYDYVSYTRNFNNTEWQALYVPFSMSYEDWCDDFEVAKINMFHQYDTDDDGNFDKLELEIIKVKSGTLKQNHPYLIKALRPGEKTITVENAMLYPAEENSFVCNSMETTYTFTGTYAGINGAEMYDNHYYSMENGSLLYAEDPAAELTPYRWYLKITDREGQVISAPANIRVIEWGNSVVTDIDHIALDGESAATYRIDGRRVQNIRTKGLYIQGGRKIMTH